MIIEYEKTYKLNKERTAKIAEYFGWPEEMLELDFVTVRKCGGYVWHDIDAGIMNQEGCFNIKENDCLYTDTCICDYRNKKLSRILL
jgi:hypothetical protein